MPDAHEERQDHEGGEDGPRPGVRGRRAEGVEPAAVASPTASAASHGETVSRTHPRTRSMGER